METLLDTHTFIWFISGDSQLSDKARMAIESNSKNNYVSVATLWEMAVKISLNKLVLKIPFQEILIHIEKNGFQLLTINFEDTVAVSQLPFHHRDPFDRILIAQSRNHDLCLISKDEHFRKYEIDILW